LHRNDQKEDKMRVLDLSQLLPGPYCTRILSDWGAEVIKVERPGQGDWLRYAPPLVDGQGALFLALNRGKKSLSLDLKSEQGRAVFMRLAQSADALLEGFRPGVMERLGLGYETLAQINPRLVYCSLTGYGPSGPYRQRAGHDLNYIALAGLLDPARSHQAAPPQIPGTQIADLTGALWTAIGMLLALLEREYTGQGQRVDCSFLGAALACLPLAVARQDAGSQPGMSLDGNMVCYHVYETQDGGYVTLGALEPKFWAAFCQAVGREDLLGQQYAPAVPGEPAYDELRTLFKSRSRQEWAQALAGVDACCEPVYNVGEALASTPVQALGMLTGAGLLPPVRLSAQEKRPASAAPALGQHNAALLAELGYDEKEVDELRQQGVI
jgi:crotonobetainyl-CoA:carnitine CoA-transferase CaiB-like acyl-CoA transferase